MFGPSSRNVHTFFVRSKTSRLKVQFSRKSPSPTKTFSSWRPVPPEYLPHSFRGAVGQAARNAGVDKSEVQAHLRIKSKACYEKHYAGNQPEVQGDPISSAVYRAPVRGATRKLAKGQGLQKAPEKGRKKPSRASKGGRKRKLKEITEAEPALPSGKRLLGAICFKEFPTSKSGRLWRRFKGSVIAFDRRQRPALYKIRYSDGDVEEKSHRELCNSQEYEWDFASLRHKARRRLDKG